MAFFPYSPRSKKTIEALWRVEKIILDSLDFNEVVQKICDSVLLELGYLDLGYEIVVLSLIDERNKVLRRISISQTKKAHQALEASPIPFPQIVIPLSYKNNILIKSLNNKSFEVSTYWPEILTPAFTEEEAINIQQLLSIKASLIYPVISKNRAIGTLIFSMSKSKNRVTQDEQDLLRSFSDIVGLAVQNATLYSQLEVATKKLKSANRNLKHLDKLKDEFVFIATHELKNPVTAMRGYLSMLQEGIFGHIPDKMKGPIDQLQASNQQLVDLVNDLLQIARSEAKTLTINTETVSLCPIIDSVIETHRPLSDQKHLKVVHIKPSKEINVKADPNRIKEIINNLLGNAIKYSDTGTITIHHHIDKEYIITSVKDQGFGISKEDQKKLFTRFYRVEEEAAKGIPGTGLGLFIVKQLIEKMGGEIWLESIKGQGTTFSFSLPRA